MIIYYLLKIILFILDIIAGLFGELIPDFPGVVDNVLDLISYHITSGINFVSYFFVPKVVVALISLIISWYSFKIIKDAVMKVIGHFIAN